MSDEQAISAWEDFWDQIARTHTPEQIAMLRKLAKEGASAFKRGRSAEAVPAGQMKSGRTTYRPARASGDSR